MTTVTKDITTRRRSVPGRKTMWALTVGLLVLWLTLLGLLVGLAPAPGTDEKPGAAWFSVWGGMLVAVPILAGAIVTGWRENSPSGFRTMLLAAVSGVAGIWAFFIGLAAWEAVNLPGQDLVSGNVDWDVLIVTSVGGVVLGLVGEGLWRVLAPRLFARHRPTSA